MTDWLAPAALLAALLALAMLALCWPLLRLPAAAVAIAPGDAAGRVVARRTAAVLCLIVPAAALALFAHLGDPAALSRQSVPAAAADLALASQTELEAHLKRQPDDARALIHLARLELRADRADRAVLAYARALGGASKAVRDPGVWVEYAEALGLAQGGTLAGRPREMVDKALAIDADHPGALDLAGSAAWEARDFAGAAGHWRRLLPLLPAGSARHAELSAAIARAEQRSRTSLPPAR